MTKPYTGWHENLSCAFCSSFSAVSRGGGCEQGMLTLQEPFRAGLTHRSARHDCWCSICWSNSPPGANKSPQQIKKERKKWWERFRQNFCPRLSCIIRQLMLLCAAEMNGKYLYMYILPPSSVAREIEGNFRS